MKVIWSLFDGSGIMGLPWAEAGYKVYCFNSTSADHGEYVIKMSHPNLVFVDLWIDANSRLFPEYGRPEMIFAFPPCTLMSNSGNKVERVASDVILAADTAKIAMWWASVFGCPWMVENPVGKLCTQWRKPDYYFHPFEYGGYMTADDTPYHPRMPMYDGYTKKTCLWTGNGFRMPDKRPVDHIGKFWAWAWMGGKGQLTKQMRSLTPRGFARAVFEFNHLR